MLKLSKLQCFFFGLFLIGLIYGAERCRHIIGSEIVTGKFAFYIDEEINTMEQVKYPIIEYIIKDSAYQFRGKENTVYTEGETVPVLLRGKNPDNPLLFDLNSFWLFPLFYFLLPLLIWVAFAMSYIDKNDIVEIGFKPPFFRKIKKP